ncbi:hypothetical protein FB567DRAFT_524832 [Paraphoma chrysanthemicola]|uniref:LYC1 C-terminal domain-containing protein n=1 Tax=Paraphoma chrysanthemicola TaxID=798071 RepID=A0A8K0R5Q1_9PLEO|nr:hypothetical protein FB567DRAFT_524832 [Paraphoma chrysanthemicola]
MLFTTEQDLPDSHGPSLRLCHPTLEELRTIWANTASSWKDALTLPKYFEESLYMATVPLAKDGGMSSWILVEDAPNPGKRKILSSCETFRTRAFTSDARGKITDGVVHAIASVFCPMEYRGRKYPQRMMQELAKILPTWQTDEKRCIGSILYSDIGKSYYGKLGWHSNSSNHHVELQPQRQPQSDLIRDIHVADLPELCERDEALLRKEMSLPFPEIKTRFSIVPDIDHMGWHLGKEDFACNHLFGKTPQAKGAISGSPGNQIWVLWTHRYYEHPDGENTSNVLYILRLVMERGEAVAHPLSKPLTAHRGEDYEYQKTILKAVLQAARNEAAEWKLDSIQLWDPSPLVRAMLVEMEVEFKIVERTETSIASGMWYDEQGIVSQEVPMWLHNEHYAWC